MQHDPPALIVGLGNPGADYATTRHNIGFMAIDRLLGGPARLMQQRHAHDSELYEVQWLGQRLTLLKPQTFMNVSGKAVRSARGELQIEPDRILVVYDDVDLPLGKLRLRRKGSSGGHNGVESIIKNLQSSQFNRLRLGIGSEHAERMRDFVLAPFAEDEQDLLDQVLDTAVEALAVAIRRGLSAAMNQINGLSLAEPTENNQSGESEG